jgi:hypothetical protein
MYLNCVEWRAVLLGNRWGRSTGHGPDARRSSERCREVVDAFVLLYEFHYGRLVLHTHEPCRPTLVQALLQRPVVRVSCGYSHTGCIVAGGEVWVTTFDQPVLRLEKKILVTLMVIQLHPFVYNIVQVYMWGSTTNGKCGLGPVVNTQECYASVPTRIMVGPEDRRVKKYSFFLTYIHTLYK